MRRPSHIVFGAVVTLVAISALLAARSSDPAYAKGMQRAHAGDLPVPTEAATTPPARAVAGEVVTYATVDGKPVKGYLARPKGAAKAGPAVVVVHEWWGLNDNIKSMTDRLAGEGYTALAVDLMGGRVTGNPDSAGMLYQAAMERVPAGEDNLRQAIAYLKRAGATSLGSVGWCFGGHWSLRTGLVGGSDLDAVVVYYGPPITDPNQLKRLDAPMLGFYGGQDQGIPVDSVRAMEQKLKDLGKMVRIKIYPNASHAFANPSGKAYNPEAARDAWQQTLAFFKQHLK